MKSARYLAIFSLLFTVFHILHTPMTVSAADVSLVVSPPRYDADIKPGETVQKTIKITNSSPDQEVAIRANVYDFIVQDNLGTPIKVTESASGRYLASPWFVLDKSEFVIPPQGQEQVVVLITAPEDALPGGHYAGVFFSSVPGKNETGTASFTSAEVGSLFGLTVEGDIKYDALVKEFNTKSRLFEYGPVEFTAVLENQSDTHIRPMTKITVSDMFGRQLEELPLEEINIFPFTSRTLSATWQNIWGLGRYTATLSAAYGPGLTAERTLYFWIMPYRLIAAVLVILLVLLVLTITVRRHLKHRADTRDAEIDELKRKVIELENKQ